MIIPTYKDLIEKYTPAQPFERDLFIHTALTNESYYSIYKKSRFIDVSELLNSLYEDKLVSYIRTNTSVMSIRQFAERFSILDGIAETYFGNKDIIRLLTNMDINLMKSGIWLEDFNFSHHALTPTSLPVNINTYFNTRNRPYEEVRKNIYLDICKSYINLFIPD